MAHWLLRSFLLPMGFVVATSVGAFAQDARQTAQTFVDGMLRVSDARDVTAMEAFLRENIDTSYGFEIAFAPVTGAVSPSQRDRLSALLLRFMAREAVLVGSVGRGGELRLVGTSEIEAGTMVEMNFRDSNGEYPFGVLVGRERENGRLLVRDMGSPRQSSVVTKLTYATQSLSLASPDANVWISAFEGALGE